MSTKKLLADVKVQEAMTFLKNDNDRMLQDTLELVQIPAFSNHEKKKAEDMLRRFRELGLEDVHMDEVWNVFGTLRGTKGTPKIIMAAHTDTVFPLDTDLTPYEKDGVWSAPGINDDTHGLADLLTIIRAIQASKLELEADVIFCANVGEEGLGDLRGVKHIFSQPNDIAAFVSLDTPEVSGIVYYGIGSLRYRVTFEGAGGHSYADFGYPSAIHAMARAVAEIADWHVPKHPKTTFNAGVVEGGTSVNTIAARCSFLMDIRSEDPAQVERLSEEFKVCVNRAVKAENDHADAGTPQVKAVIEQVGFRPAGMQPDDCQIVRLAQEACRAVGVKPELSDKASTDANIPIAEGIPALSVGRGGREGCCHTVNEWFDPTDAYIGAQKNLLLLLLMAGVDGVAPAGMEARHNPGTDRYKK